MQPPSVPEGASGTRTREIHPAPDAARPGVIGAARGDQGGSSPLADRAAADRARVRGLLPARRRRVWRSGGRVVPPCCDTCDTRPTVLPSESSKKAIHSSVPAGPSLSSRVGEDHVRFADDTHPVGAEPFDRRRHIVHLEVDQTGGCPPVKKQPHRTHLEEHQPGRVEHPGRLGVEQPRVERPGPIEIDGTLGNLEDVGHNRLTIERARSPQVHRPVDAGSPTALDRGLISLPRRTPG